MANLQIHYPRLKLAFFPKLDHTLASSVNFCDILLKHVLLAGMKSINHLKKYSHWYKSMEYFQSRTDDILFIGFQETLSRDFSILKSHLAISKSCPLPTGDVEAHRSPSNIDSPIEDRGILALKEWYQEDTKFISICKEFMTDAAPQRTNHAK
jgi:hypothetical protein